MTSPRLEPPVAAPFPVAAGDWSEPGTFGDAPAPTMPTFRLDPAVREAYRVRGQVGRRAARLRRDLVSAGLGDMPDGVKVQLLDLAQRLDRIAATFAEYDRISRVM